MNYQILKQVIDSAGNIGFIFDQNYTGNDAGVAAFISSLIAGDGIFRFAQTATDLGVRTIQ